MSNSNRQQYLSAMVLDQDFLNESQDNLTCQLELGVEITAPDGSIIYASDRNKYIGERFYEALVNFPTITRTIGEWLDDEIEFSSLTIEVSNADGRFNKYMPGGTNYGSWIGNSVKVRLGLRDVNSSYTTIFNGFITDIGGFQRSIKSFTIIARDEYDKLNVNFPKVIFGTTAYPNIQEDVAGKFIPIIYGDWTINVEPVNYYEQVFTSPPDTMGASIPCFIVNGLQPGILDGTVNIQFVVAFNALSVLDVTRLFLVRNDQWYRVPVIDVTSISVSLNSFSLLQDLTGGIMQVFDSSGALVPYRYENGDQFFIRCRGKDLGAYDDNIVEQARDILITYGGLSSVDFDANWDTYRDKASPAQSNIAGIKSRIWLQEQQPVMKYVLSLLEQVRLEAFINRNLKVKINSLHLEDWNPSPSYRVTNFDVIRESFSPRIDNRNNINRVKAIFNFLPNRNDNFSGTNIFKNNAAITAAGKDISKQILFPNLYIEADAENQVKEILKLASAYFEHIECTLTWRALLLDIGDFVKLNVQIGAATFIDVPCMIRSISYDPAGIKLPVKLWSMQLVPFGSWPGAGSGITGGATATILIDS